MSVADIWNTIEDIECSIIISQSDLDKIDNILETVTQNIVTETEYGLLSEYYCIIGYIGYHFNSVYTQKRSRFD